ncbi:MAG: VWA domain-containing protein [Chloroflexi bacterium]|nr:VWA domain-containing protein [Chloroflexota bacterium]
MQNSNSNSNTSGHLLNNLILFGRLLRGLGLDMNPGRVMDVAHALEHVQIGRKPDFYFTLRSLLVHRHEDLSLFDEAFDAFWRKPVEGELIALPGLLHVRRPKKPRVVAPPLNAPPDPEGELPPPDPDQPPVVEVTLTYSDSEVLRKRDFSEMTGDELAAVKQLMAALVWHLGERRTRRKRPGHGQFIDLRRTVRKNLRYGGEILTWAQREFKFKPRPLVIIADVSGSMERYTRLLLHFIYGLTVGLHQPVESFVFSTRLTHVTRQLNHKNIDRALHEVSLAVNDWSGGTRMGDVLKDFNFHWGRRVLGRGAIVLLISDGWDRGDTDLLGQEMARLQRNCHRLIWLNPLLGSPEYEPLTRGMQAALPHIDDFLPVHNLASLEDLAEHLVKLDGRRTPRRQAGTKV